ncbi:MAG: preprotein translocase subunit YajC [Nitrospirae bacterium RBG_16_64_22]|nr:MAG: preprotein translocase subunit YajC [Nitrospirae bacterium RBG_16_64_22]
MFGWMNILGMAPPSGGGGGPEGTMGVVMSFLPIVVIFGIFYFLLIRPQQKKAKDHKQLLDNLKKGDRIITVGGLIGQVTAMGANVLTIEIAKDVRVRVARSHVAGIRGSDEE